MTRSDIVLAEPEAPKVPTAAQFAVVRERRQHLLVSAGAGTGKTFTVVSRLLYEVGVAVGGEVVDSPLALEDVAAITFTNKAAAELKQKLRDGLRDAHRRADAYAVDGARVGTIHAFCGDILREFALRSGRSPSLSLMEEGEASVLAEQAVTETLLGALDEAPSAQLAKGLSTLLSMYSAKDIATWMGELVEKGSSLPALFAKRAQFGSNERTLVELATLAQARLEEMLVERGALDFDRMITWTRDLLRDDAGARRALQRRIKLLVVDEFQDVDPVQREIAYLLADPESGRTDTTRLVLVGDPKQSIYRFRKADVSTWRFVERDFAERGWGRVVPLTYNRRSVPAILGFVDHAIGTLLDTPLRGGELEDFEVAYAPLHPLRPDGDREHPVEVIVIPPNEEGKAQKAEVVRLSEARAMARRAKELHADGVPWKEMALLMTSWSGLELYTDAFAKENIPTYALRSDGFYECMEIVDCLVALKAIRDPRDDRALVGFFRSPFVAVSDETLLRLRKGVAAGPLWNGLTGFALADAAEAARLARGVELLRKYSALRDRVPSATLLEDLLEESGYLAHLGLMGADGLQRLANLQKLVRTLGVMREESLGEALATIGRARELGVRVGSARLHAEGDDVVTISTVHSAKGLEWSVVFWCDLVRGKSADRTRLYVAGDEIALALPDVESDEQPENVLRLKERICAEQDAETKRLWYVAATRAKDLLVLASIAQKDAPAPKAAKKKKGADAAEEAEALQVGGVYKPLGNACAELSAAFGGLASRAADPSSPPSQSSRAQRGICRYESRSGRQFSALVLEVDRVVTQEDGAAEELAVVSPDSLSAPYAPIELEATRWRQSATQLMALEKDKRYHDLRYLLGLKREWITAADGTASWNGTPGERRADGSRDPITHGLIVHDVLEHYREDADVEELIGNAMDRWDPAMASGDLQSLRQYRERLARVMAVALNEPQLRDVLSVSGARQELAFVWLRELGQVDGKLDVAARHEQQYQVVDLKTGPSDLGELESRYGLQRRTYSEAVEAICGSQTTFAFVLADSPPTTTAG
ncbi:MAG: helicase [Gemmatimonadetes bacterium]|nr:helicase [Gemmatimonadota bacterium]